MAQLQLTEDLHVCVCVRGGRCLVYLYIYVCVCGRGAVLTCRAVSCIWMLLVCISHRN